MAANSNQCKSCDKWRSGQQKESVTVTGHKVGGHYSMSVCMCVLVTDGVCWHLTPVLTTWPLLDLAVWLRLQSRGSWWLKLLTDGSPLFFWLKALTCACPQQDWAGWANRGSATWPSCPKYWATGSCGACDGACLLVSCLHVQVVTMYRLIPQYNTNAIIINWIMLLLFISSEKKTLKIFCRYQHQDR